jgi:hypothetical protein
MVAPGDNNRKALETSARRPYDPLSLLQSTQTVHESAPLTEIATKVRFNSIAASRAIVGLPIPDESRRPVMTLRSVSMFGYLTVLCAGFSFACSSKNSTVSDGGGASTTPEGGAGGTVPGSGTATGGTGTTSSSSTSTTNSGGTTTGGTTTPAAGGTNPSGTTASGAGGATTPGAGGTNPGSTTTPAAGGTNAGSTGKGGASGAGSGGRATGGAGGGAAKGGASGGTAKGGTTGSAAKGGAAGSVATSSPPSGDFSDKVGSASVDMIAIPGGTFTLGCETSTCDTDTSPVENITVSDYHIMKAHAASAVWSAVGLTEGTWYDCMALACELTKQTGHAYRVVTEAEFEYAAKKYLDKLSQIDGTEEWAFNSWETKYSCKPGDVDPLGPTPGSHTQKTRRDKATGDKITGRLIRSIDGIGPKCRLTISDKTDYPPGYPAACNIKQPVQCPEPENSYRDPRWVTGSDDKWTTGSTAIGKFDLQTWDDGTAIMNGKNGQWFTSNNITFVFVPSAGSAVKYPYMFLDCSQGSVISDAGFMSGFIGRFQKTGVTSSTTKPTLSGLKSGAELAAAAGADYAMVDMQNIPDSAKKQDSRLIDTLTDCWFQNNINAGGTHNYRKDIDADEFRFAVIDKGNIVMLANGKWWTVNNTFLHVEHSTGYVAEYLYALTSDGYFFHDSYMAYERADFRMFQKYTNDGGQFPTTCINDSCSKELAKGAAASLYSKQGETGKSTFVPAPCPADGCK